MSWAFFTVLICLSTAAVTSGKLYLTIVKNENGMETPTESLLKTNSRANFALICRTMDTKGKKLTQDDIIWDGKEKNPKSMDKMVNGATLNFTGVTMKDQGKYFCVSRKHKLVKIIFIAVKPEQAKDDLKYSTFRQKRFMNNYDNSKDEWDDEDVQSDNLNRETTEDGRDLWDFKTEERRLENAREEKEEKVTRELMEKKEAVVLHKKHFKTIFIIVGTLLGCATMLYIVYKCTIRNNYRILINQSIANLMTENRRFNESIRRMYAERESIHDACKNKDNVGSYLVQPSFCTDLGPDLQKNMIINEAGDEPPPPYEVAVAKAPPCDDGGVSHLKF